VPEGLRWWWLRRSLFHAQRRQPTWSLEAVLEGRRMFDELAELATLPVGLNVVAEDANGVAVEWLGGEGVLDAASDGLVLYIHGGAYTMGSVAAARGAAAVLHAATGLPILAVGYRLAPEHPFPAASDDVLTAYRWLLAAGRQPDRIVLAGDSAGGGLVLAVLLAARAAGLPLPAGGITTSMWADLALAGASYGQRCDRDPLLSPEFLGLCADLYAPDGDRRLAADVLGADLSGLPPLLLLVGTEEIVHDDSVTVAARARAAGVDARLHVGTGRLHCWTGWVDRFPSIREDLDLVGRFCAEVLGTGTERRS